MPQINFNDVLKQLQDGITQLATTSVKDYAKDAQADGLTMLTSLEADLQNWTTELANGDITAKDLQYLINAKNNLIQMNALKQAGLAAVRIDEFKASAIQFVVNTLTGLIKV